MAYSKIAYENSAAYHACMDATSAAQLLNRKRYTCMAIEFHESKGNTDQVVFFQEDLNLIEKRLLKFQARG